MKLSGDLVNIREAARLLGVSPSTMRRLEEGGEVRGYGLVVHYTPGGQRRYRMDEIQACITNRGFAARIGFGTRPAVVVIDLARGFLDLSSPLGFNAKGVVEATTQVLSAARLSGIPIAFSVTCFNNQAGGSSLWTQKMPALNTMTTGSAWLALDRRLGRRRTEPIIYTPMISHLHDPKLVEFLQSHGVDSVILCGVTTSGAIRASAIDALQLGLRPIIPSEAVGDRNRAAHLSSLSDVDTKYGDVVSVQMLTAHLLDKRSAGAMRG